MKDLLNDCDAPSWMAALRRGKPKHILPRSLAAEVLEISKAALSVAIKNGRFAEICIGKKTYLLLEDIMSEWKKSEAVVDDVEVILEEYARLGETIFYGELMERVDLNWRSPPDRNTIGVILAKVSRRSHAAGHGLLSALVHRKSADPTTTGPGFFNLARSMDLLREDKSEVKFLRKQMEKVWASYKPK
jgi:hypothetical protein